MSTTVTNVLEAIERKARTARTHYLPTRYADTTRITTQHAVGPDDELLAEHIVLETWKAVHDGERLS